MSLYVGSIENWNNFFNQFWAEGDHSFDMDDLISNPIINDIKDLDDFLRSGCHNLFNKINTHPNFGKISKESSLYFYKDDYIYPTTLECIVGNTENYIEIMDNCLIQKYKNFHDYELKGDDHKASFSSNLTEVHEDYIDLIKKSFILNNDDAWHETILIPYGELCEVWLMESSAELYRFRCFAELIVVHTITSHLGYQGFDEINFNDLKKYNVDLILNLDLLQQSDIPMK